MSVQDLPTPDRPSYRDMPGCENLVIVPGDPRTIPGRIARLRELTRTVLERVEREKVEAAHAAD